MLALCDIIGVVGAKYLIEQINTLIYENLVKIKAIVVQNKEILQSLRITFDRPEMMKDFYKRLESKILLDLIKIEFFEINKSYFDVSKQFKETKFFFLRNLP